MTAFTHPKRGESPEDFQKRRQSMIEYIMGKHGWPYERALDLLEDLGAIGAAYVEVDMKEDDRNAKRARAEYSPFPW